MIYFVFKRIIGKFDVDWIGIKILPLHAESLLKNRSYYIGPHLGVIFVSNQCWYVCNWVHFQVSVNIFLISILNRIQNIIRCYDTANSASQCDVRRNLNIHCGLEMLYGVFDCLLEFHRHSRVHPPVISFSLNEMCGLLYIDFRYLSKEPSTTALTVEMTGMSGGECLSSKKVSASRVASLIGSMNLEWNATSMYVISKTKIFKHNCGYSL